MPGVLRTVGLLATVLVVSASAAAASPQIEVGGFPTGIALDPATHTLYVGNGTTNTVSLIDGRSCNAGSTAACHRHASAVTGGLDPVGIAIDDGTHTAYVVNASGTVAVVDLRTCRSGQTSGCTARPRLVRVGLDPQFLALDRASHTLYVANTGSNTVSVIDTRQCNADAATGCRVGGTARAGPSPFAVAVDSRTHTVYVSDLGAPQVAVLDARTCNGADTSGCRRAPATVTVGEIPGGIAVDPATGTVYVTGQASNDVSVIDGRSCNARVTTGCGRRPRRVAAGAGARGVALNRVTHTLYVANSGANSVSVIDTSACNARVQAGCGRRAAAVPVGVSPRRVAVDEATNTVYVTNAGSDSVSMLDGRTCNGRVRRGCGDLRTA